MAANEQRVLPTAEQRPAREPRCSVRHRRSVSDPTDVMQALRSERSQKRDLSPTSKLAMCEEEGLPKKQHADICKNELFQGSCFDTQSECGDNTDDMLLLKKDVPMWTVEEDLLILQLADQHGKRWSKIAAHLPGRTDNGVRNRWNRMQRGQSLREVRGPDAGYRCRRCGQPKRGHICAALTKVGEAPAGNELQSKAEALTRFTANKMRPESPGIDITGGLSTQLPSETPETMSLEELQQLSLDIESFDEALGLPQASCGQPIKQASAPLFAPTPSAVAASVSGSSELSAVELHEAGLDLDDLLSKLQQQEDAQSVAAALPRSYRSYRSMSADSETWSSQTARTTPQTTPSLFPEPSPSPELFNQLELPAPLQKPIFVFPPHFSPGVEDTPPPSPRGAAPAAKPAPSAPPVRRRPSPTPTPAPPNSVRVESFDLEFGLLEELQLDEHAPKQPQQPSSRSAPLASTAILSQASLHHLLMKLSAPESGAACNSPALSQTPLSPALSAF